MTRFLYANTLRGFLADQRTGVLVDVLRQRYEVLRGGEAVGPSEIDAWRHSLPALAGVLEGEEFEAAEVFVELFMPLDNRRCDALLTGVDDGGAESGVVVELKQWSAFSPSHLPEHVYAGGRQELHPSVQVRGYVDTLLHYHSAFTSPGVERSLHGCAFLHNMRRTSSHARHLRDPAVFGSVPHDYPVFFTDEARLLTSWLARRLCGGTGAPLARRIERGAYLPSPRLLDHLVDTVKGTHEWRLLDVQRTVYWGIRHAVQVARDTATRKVVVVHGGPGTGKSVLAVQLLADAARQRWVVAHATGSLAFQKVLQARTLDFSASMLKTIHNARLKRELPVGDLFTTFAQVAKVGADDPGRFDLVVCDEAHRLWQHRRMKYPNGKVKWLTDTSMIDELIMASRVTAFFLDDNQSVRSGEIGRAERIVESARRLGVEVESFYLDAQFRCAGSESYIRWVEHLCGHRSTNDVEWRVHRAYEVKIWHSMPALDAHLRALLSEGAAVRWVAGYCWRWREPDANGTLPSDLDDPRFDGWRGSWIKKTEQDLAPRDHRYYRWATDADAFDEVGSIYSAQGFEFDHVGVIWGEDLVWRTDRWEARLDANKDTSFKRELRLDGGNPVEKLLNVYRVLLTRGMRSTHLFILDDETRAHVRACLEAQQSVALASGDLEGRAESAPLARTSSDVHDRRPRLTEPTASTRFRTCVPLIPLRAAAGGFSLEQFDLDSPRHAVVWVTWDAVDGLQSGMFAARVVGTSMEPAIPSGSLCLFRPVVGLATSRRPILLRHGGPTDDETGGQFTVKDVRVLGDPPHRVELRSRNPAFAPMVFESAHDLAAITPLAEMVAVLGKL